MSRILPCYICDQPRPVGCLTTCYDRKQPGAAFSFNACMEDCALPYVLTRPCEACGLAESLEGDIDCLKCKVEGDLDAVNIELEMMA